MVDSKDGQDSGKVDAVFWRYISHYVKGDRAEYNCQNPGTGVKQGRSFVKSYCR